MIHALYLGPSVRPLSSVQLLSSLPFAYLARYFLSPSLSPIASCSSPLQITQTLCQRELRTVEPNRMRGSANSKLESEFAFSLSLARTSLSRCLLIFIYLLKRFFMSISKQFCRLTNAGV